MRAADAASKPAAVIGSLCVAAALGLGAWNARAALHARTSAAPPGGTGFDLGWFLLVNSWLPRVLLALVAGAALALAAAAIRRVLRNPLADPATIGVTAGSHLALLLGTILIPTVTAELRSVVSIVGGLVAGGFVLLLAGRSRFAPLEIILAGMTIGLYSGTLGALLSLIYRDRLGSVFIWSAGRLNDAGWEAVASLAAAASGLGLVLFALARVVEILDLGDGAARGVGLKVLPARSAIVLAAVVLAALVVAVVGVIAFVGLAANAIVAACGARRFRSQLGWAALVGGGLLCIADQATLLLSGVAQIPVGAVTVVLGAPLLLGVLRRERLPPSRPHQEADGRPVPRAATSPKLAILALAALFFLAWLAVSVGRGTQGWLLDPTAWPSGLLQLRWPRVVAAAASGALLGLSGAMIQRLSGNALASPELLGVSAGAVLGVIAATLALGALDRPMQFAAASGGAVAVLAAAYALGRRSALDPQHILLAGLAATALMSGVVSLLLASGDRAFTGLMAWMAGSTYRVTGADAALACTAAMVLMMAAAPLARPLGLLPLGTATATSLGLSMPRSRLPILAVSAAASAAATLIVGPLSFVGLMAPHMARTMGLQRPMPHLYGAAVIGALIMVFADWLGRNILFPYQIPAGLLAAFVGAPYALLSMARRAR